MMLDSRIYLADIVTSITVLAGFASIVLDSMFASIMLLTLGIIADALDGIVARRFGSSESGMIYDSIADIITFCLAPSVLLYQFGQEIVWILLSLLYLFASLLHMRRFIYAGNLDGCPTTIASAGIVYSVAFGSMFGVIFVTVLLSAFCIRKTEYTKDVGLVIKIVVALIMISYLVIEWYFAANYGIYVSPFVVLATLAYGVLGARWDSIRLI